MIHHRGIRALLTLTLALTGCGANGGLDIDTDTDPDSDADVDAPGDGSGEPGDETDDDVAPLVGTSESGCRARADGRSERESFTFDGASVRFVELTYLDTTCSKPGWEYLVRMRTAGSSAVALSESPRALDLIVESVAALPRDSGLIDTLDEVAYCGVSSWTLGIPSDITGATCGSAVQPAKDSGVYTMYATDANDTLHIGELATAAASRPASAGTESYMFVAAATDVSSPSECEQPFLCNSQGLYQQCYDYNGDYWYETCYTYTAFGGGLACDRAKAELLALANCESHRTSLVIISNISGRATSIGSCSVTSCSQ
jgi:predicted small lipoprotein YifL